MNWALVILSVTAISRRSEGAYVDYDPSQSVHQGRGYQGPPVVPVILPGGFIADTEEVAKAKDLHFNAYAHAASSVKDARYNAAADGQSYQQPRYTHVVPVVRQQAYVSTPLPQQPQRQQDYNVPQQYTGTAGRSYSAKPAVNYQPSYSSQPQARYQGPPVIPVILPNGYIAETADVEAAKEHHFQLVAKAQAAVARAQERANKNYGYTGAAAAQAAYAQEDDGSQYDEPEQNYNQVYQSSPSAPIYSKPSRQSYQGPPVVPVVLPSGHIADTAEVAAAKISHLQQLLDAAQKSQQEPRYHTSR